MSDYNEGDLVEIVKGETEVRGRVTVNPLGVAAIEYQPGINWMVENGFTATVIERAKPALPTTPGSVIRIQRDFDPTGWICQRGIHGIWFSTDGHTYSHSALAALVTEYGHEYEVLAPVAETAKSFVEQIKARGIYVAETRDTPYFAIDDAVLTAIAAEFGVTS